MIESSKVEQIEGEEAHGHHIHEVNEQDRLYVDDDDDQDESFGQVDLNTPTQPRLPTSTIAAQANDTTTPLFGSIASPLAKLSFTGQIGLLALFSTILLVQSSVNCSNGRYECSGNNAFAVAGSVISLVAALAALYYDMQGKLTDKLFTLFTLGMFAWWSLLVLCVTFFGPFSSVQFANGFFSTWGGFLCATVMLSSRNESFRDAMGRVVDGVSRKPAAYILIASLIELGSAIPYCVPQSQCHSLNAFAIALGAVSLTVSLVMLVFMHSMPVPVIKQVAAFLLLWWVVGGMLVTFIGPFVTVGNGYFAVAGAVAASASLMQTKEEGSDEQPLESGNMV